MCGNVSFKRVKNDHIFWMDLRVMVGVFGCNWADVSDPDGPVEMPFLATEKSQR